MIPVVLHLENKKVLVVGDGKVANRKIRQLIKEKADITVVAKECDHKYKIKYIEDEYKEEYLEGMFLAYAATNDKDVNHRIIEDCNRLNILCGSAKYEEQSSFFSMNTAENEVGMIGLSTFQKIPYSKPLLDQMMNILDENKERLTMIADLRNYILKKLTDSKDYFTALYNMSDEWLRFIHDSTIKGIGYIFIYHPGSGNENFKFTIDPHITLTIEDFKLLQEYLIFDVKYKIIPLVLSDGIIYRRIVKSVKISSEISTPIIHTEQDVKDIISAFQNGQNTIYIIHPRKDTSLKDTIRENLLDNEEIYDFLEQYKLKPNEVNRVVLFLVTHGGHYQDIKDQLNLLEKMGFQIEFIGTLLDNPNIIKWLENKVR